MRSDYMDSLRNGVRFASALPISTVGRLRSRVAAPRRYRRCVTTLFSARSASMTAQCPAPEMWVKIRAKPGDLQKVHKRLCGVTVDLKREIV